MTDDALPFVTVVIPTYQRPQALAHCLASLAAQDYPGDRFDVVVVNDGGVAPLDEVIDAHARDLRLTLLHVPHGGPAAARNRGAAAGGGTLLAFIDDDCVADRHWLATLVAVLREAPQAAVGGRVANALPGNPYVRASQTLLSFLYRHYHERKRGLLPFVTTNNLAVRADLFAELGGFDVSFPFASEDREWCDRCRAAGHPLVYAADAVVHHAQELTFAGFVRMHLRYGEGAWRFHRARAARGERSNEVESLAFYTGMLSAPFESGDPQPGRQALLLFLSQAIAVVGYARAALQGARASGADGRRG